MSVLEQLFSSSVLDLAVPDTSLEYPPSNIDADNWLEKLSNAQTIRKQAFFDEQLQFFLIIRIENHTQNVDVDVEHTPAELVTFISHLQISVEATYISSTPASNAEVIHSARISTPPRTTSFGQAMTHDSLHPSIFPPATPNPTPSTADDDRRYSGTEGTLLHAGIWGQNALDKSVEAFSLLWSQKEQVWVAVYRLGITVSFLRLSISNPLLCLTVSSTLREKPVALTWPGHPLASFLAAQEVTQVSQIAPLRPPADSGAFVSDERSDELNGLQEVNLLEGLGSGPTFLTSGPDRVYLPTTRLGGVTRRRLFSLPPVVPVIAQAPSPAPSTARITHAILRKSFRKTLQTVSGFRVRMRTVFVPYVLLPTISDGVEQSDEQEQRERREAGNDEHTVVLCVEIENSGESGRRIGFAVETVDVQIGGEGARATLIGWQKSVPHDLKKDIFPLLISSTEQYNLLYAVSFFRVPGDVDGFSLTSDGGSMNADLQRSVTINIFGRPFLLSERLSISDAPNLIAEQNIDGAAGSGTVSFPTPVFSSRWNCILDLSSNQNSAALPDIDVDEDNVGPNNQVLPEPASPFPPFSPRTASTMGMNSAFPPMPSSQAVAGSRRPMFPETPFARWSAKSSTPTAFRPIPSFLPNRPPPNAASKPGLTGLAGQYPTTPTTYAPPPTATVFDHDENNTPSAAAYGPVAKLPTTPAYPPHSALSPIPASFAPVTNQTASVVGPSVEIRRDRGSVIGGVPVPRTPGPTLTNTFGDRGLVRYRRGENNNGQSIIVSIGLLPPPVRPQRSFPDRILPLDQFTLDIFVYNESERTRRFEVSCPHRRRRKLEEGDVVGMGGGIQRLKNVLTLGILPLDNRVRIGPLLPATCQSVRMQFLALAPGVHTVDVVTLTDIESGYSINLRSILDVVVHERDGDA